MLIGPGLADVPAWLSDTLQFLKVVVGFSLIIFVHELGHFLAAKWVGVRVDRFAIGFGYRLFGWRRGEGFTFGNRPNYVPADLSERRYGETDYCFKALPFGGYVKMLGQDDIQIDDKTGRVWVDDPRAFTNRPVRHRMMVVSAGVLANLAFAAVVFMGVFLAGIRMPAPVIGLVDPESPAARAGLLAGDRVLSINGRHTDTFKDVAITTVLGDGPFTFEVQRDGKPLDHPIVVDSEWSEAHQFKTIGVLPLFTTTLTRDGDAVEGSPDLRAGDRIISVNGEPVRSAIDVHLAFQRSRGGVADVVAERPDPGDPSQSVTVHSRQRARFVISGDPQPERGVRGDDAHVLGFRPRRSVGVVVRGGAAEKAGVKEGDVIASWNGVPQPTFAEITEAIAALVDKPCEVVVERAGRLVPLTIVTRRPFSFFGGAKPMAGISFEFEDGRPIMSGVPPAGTPAARLDLPRGAEILSVDGSPTPAWHDVIDALAGAAGRSVTVEYVSGGTHVTAETAIPSSLVNELALPPDAVIRSINGQDKVKVQATDAKGQKREVQMSLPSPAAVKRLLASQVGQTVSVRYRVGLGAAVEKRFHVTADNVDPWQLRYGYDYEWQSRFSVAEERIHAHGNPLRAMWMGVELTTQEVVGVYQVIKQMASRNMSVEYVEGPVGILSRATEVAKEGFTDLAFFLAILSVNLAVINFLPLPVVDGGLMLFLLIEKIKGRPLSMKTQMVSTLVGLALIVICFLAVTVKDVVKLFS